LLEPGLNKGFGMLLNMGYKPGVGLGKNEDGMLEPVKMPTTSGMSFEIIIAVTIYIYIRYNL
jgi:hypothetical protein